MARTNYFGSGGRGRDGGGPGHGGRFDGRCSEASVLATDIVYEWKEVFGLGDDYDYYEV